MADGRYEHPLLLWWSQEWKLSKETFKAWGTNQALKQTDVCLFCYHWVPGMHAIEGKVPGRLQLTFCYPLLNQVSRTLTQPGIQDSCTWSASLCFSSCRKVKMLLLETPCLNSHFHATIGRHLDYIEEFISLLRSLKDIKTGPRQVTPGLALPVCQALNNAFCSFQILSSLS